MLRVQAPPPPKPVQIAQKLRAQLVGMKQASPGQDERLKACWGVLLRYCGNIAQVCPAASTSTALHGCSEPDMRS